jgi:precorrin-2 dehydrogenase/sirohydrochlorin ferrochelatase
MSHDSPLYPVALVVDGRRCLVVGGGPIATHKAEGLLDCRAHVTVVAPLISERLRRLVEDASAPSAGQLVLEPRPYRTGEASDYRLVITATGDAAVDREVAADAEAAGVWVNSADDPANCSFTLPAVVRQGPIMVTVGTGGHSPALATWLLRHIEGELDTAFTTLLDLLAERRAAIRAEGRGTEGLSWQAVLDGGMLDLVREGRIDEARERLRCL